MGIIVPYIYSCLFLLSLLLSNCIAIDVVYADQPIRDGKTIVSSGNMFELGFFSPGKSKNRYLGIWYKKVSICTVVWVANREIPITDKSGMFKVSSDGNIKIFNGSNTMVWSSKSTVSKRSNNPVLQLLDSGNLVVWESDRNATNENLIWQSFDYLGDTFLPGMKFGKDLITGKEWSMTSWKSPDDPYPGFEPKNPEEWDASDWSSGCKRKKPLNCGDIDGDGFQKTIGIKVPDTRRSWYNVSMTLGECEMSCRMKCNCTAYANLDITNGGSGCLLWFDELLDIRDYDELSDHNIYIRMAASELAGRQSDSNRTKRVFTSVLSVSSASLLLCAVAYSCRKRNKRLQKKDKGDMEYALDKKNSGVQTQLLGDLPFISLYKLAKVTNNFSVSNKIGEGGFGPVYKGVLEDGKEVAVKRPSDTSHQGIKEFRNELVSISKLQHRNLVKLLGYCIHGNEMILIYEYMANKSLDTIIFDETRSSMLDWPQRFGIIHGTARGILYLHQDSRLQIIHRDLKAGNILLDGDMNPKISDFGLARKFVGQDNIAMTKKVVGTYGCISPEYAVHGHFSVKSDVFSFGVLVLEIVSGKKNREFSHEDHSDNLLGHAWRLYKQGRSIELLSESLRASCVVPEVIRSIHVALLCVQHHAKDRPTMLSVLLMLVSDSALPPPKQPAFSTEEENTRKHDSVSSFDEYMITLLYPR